MYDTTRRQRLSGVRSLGDTGVSSRSRQLEHTDSQSPSRRLVVHSRSRSPLVPGATWILYVVDLSERSFVPLKRLKTVLVLNSTLVALAWATAMVFLPIVFADAAITPLAVVLTVYFFADIFVNTEIPNVRDIEDDAQNDVSTFPTVVGVRRTRHLLYMINILSILVVVGAFLGGYLPMLFALILLAGRVLAVLLNSRIGRSDDYRRLELLGEMNYVFVASVLLIAVFG